MADQCLWPSTAALAHIGAALLKDASATQAALGFEATNTMRALRVHGLDDHAIALTVGVLSLAGRLVHLLLTMLEQMVENRLLVSIASGLCRLIGGKSQTHGEKCK